MTRSEKLILAMILVVSLAIRVGLWSHARTNDVRLDANDTASYLGPARALLELGTFSTAPDLPSEPEAVRTPGYPLFAAAGLRLGGLEAILLLQCIVGTATILGTFLLGRQLGNSTAGLLAAGLLALDPLSLGYTLVLLTETPFTAILLGSCLALARFTRVGGLRWASLAGILLGLATLVRPTTYYLGILAPIALWLLGRRFYRPAVRAALPFLIGVACIIVPWQLRNFSATGSAQLSRIESVNLLFFRAADVLARAEGIDLDEARDRIAAEIEAPALHSERYFPAADQAKQWQRHAIKLLARHPGPTAAQVAEGVTMQLVATGHERAMRLVGVPAYPTGPLGDVVRLKPAAYLDRWVVRRPFAGLVFVLSAIFLVGVEGLAIWGWTQRYRANVAALDVMLAILVLYMLLVQAGPEAGARFRVPIMPILSCYAAIGALSVSTALRNRASGSTGHK